MGDAPNEFGMWPAAFIAMRPQPDLVREQLSDPALALVLKNQQG
jgi:hypothetical protein